MLFDLGVFVAVFGTVLYVLTAIGALANGTPAPAR